MVGLKMGPRVLRWANIQSRLTGVHKRCGGEGHKSEGAESVMGS